MSRIGRKPITIPAGVEVKVDENNLVTGERYFDENGNLKEPQTSTEESAGHVSAHRIKIRRRFDISDSDYLKPISGGKIILYCFLVCLLLYWILF